MILKAVLVITICTIIPHAAAGRLNLRDEIRTKSDVIETDIDIDVRDIHQYTNQNVVAENDSLLLGYWEVQYEDPTVKVVYELKQEQGVIKGYSVQLEDEDGNTMRDNTLAILINSVSDKTTKARYFMEYKGEKYEVNCELKIEANKLILTYSYFGFDEQEVWHKTTQL